MGKKKVSYFYDQDIGGFYYGADHPMKPHRIRLTHALVLHCGLANELDMFKIKKASPTDLVKFHSPEYVKFLQRVTPSNRDKMNPQCKQFNVGDDCPIFEGLFDYCSTYAGGSIAGAIKLNYKSSDVVINWAGGLHHAKKGEASGFCYVNDIVLAILELLKYHKRVLYVDIDIHHGDGVEEAFLTTDRVFTVSFHKFGGGFFPGTGDISHVGRGKGKYYALNVPLNNGIDDESYEFLFKPILDKVVEMYQPEAVVFQSGADSLAGDRLGHFNLSMKGHAACQLHVLNYGLPTLVVGGGGYKISNTARCWAYETGRIVGKDLGETLPETEYQEYFGTSELQIPVRRDLVNENTREYLEKIRLKAFENLTMLGAVPSTSFQERPPDAMDIDDIVSQQAEAPAPPRLWDDKPRDPDDNEPGGKRARADISYRMYQDENDISGSPGGMQSTSTSGPERSEKGSEMEGSQTERWPSATEASAMKPAIPSTSSFAVLANGKGPGEELSNGKGPAEGEKGDEPMPERPRLEPWPAGTTVPPVANS